MLNRLQNHIRDHLAPVLFSRLKFIRDIHVFHNQIKLRPKCPKLRTIKSESSGETLLTETLPALLLGVCGGAVHHARPVRCAGPRDTAVSLLGSLNRTVGSCRKYSWHLSGSPLRMNQNINTELKVCLKLREDERREAAGPDDGSDPHTPTQLTKL